jgi:hypothetical protein
MRTSNGGSSLCGNEEFAWRFGSRSSGMQVGATTHGKFGENPRSGLSWLCLVMVLLKTLF